MDTPSPELLKEVRAVLVRRGTSLAAFCGEHGFVRQHVGRVLSGQWKGPKASDLMHRFLDQVRATE